MSIMTNGSLSYFKMKASQFIEDNFCIYWNVLFIMSTDEKPKVECSLVTEFQDHIFVAVDAESFFFLHDLIASYVKDTKEKMVRLDSVFDF